MALKSSEQPLISVCIAHYNGRAYIGTCLESVLSQEVQASFEVIVHDDASTDQSSEYIQEHFPDVRLLRSERNVGFCISNNRMVAIARGNYLLLLNNDAVLHRGALQALFSRAEQIGRPCILGLPQYELPTGSLIDRGSLFDPFLNPVPIVRTGRRDVGMVSGACLWISKDLWNELGGFPEYFFNIAEDTYVCCVARLWGYPVEVVDTSGFDHWIGKNIGGGRIESGRISTTFSRRYHSERNKSCVMYICYPLPLLLILLPIHLCMLTMEGVLLSLLRKDRNVWKEIYARALQYLWSHRAFLHEERLRVQGKRSAGITDFTGIIAWQFQKLKLLCTYGAPGINRKPSP
jgi:GT2 family glycosyltransferase